MFDFYAELLLLALTVVYNFRFVDAVDYNKCQNVNECDELEQRPCHAMAVCIDNVRVFLHCTISKRESTFSVSFEYLLPQNSTTT